MDVSRRIADLSEIGRGLLDLLGQENRALRENDYHRVQELLERKTDLVRAFETRFEGLSKHMKPEDLAAVDDGLREDLRDVGKAVDQMVRENSKLLLVAMEVQRRVVECIASAVKSANGGPGTYSPAGVVGAPNRKGKRAASFSYDQAL